MINPELRRLDTPPARRPLVSAPNTEIGSGGAIPVEVYQVQGSTDLAQGIVDYAVNRAREKEDVTITMMSAATDFTPGQAKALAEAGVRIKAFQPDVGAGVSGDALKTLAEAGVEIRQLNSPAINHVKFLTFSSENFEPRSSRLENEEALLFADSQHNRGKDYLGVPNQTWRDTDISGALQTADPQRRFVEEWGKSLPASFHTTGALSSGS